MISRFGILADPTVEPRRHPFVSRPSFDPAFLLSQFPFGIAWMTRKLIRRSAVPVPHRLTLSRSQDMS